MSAKQRGENVQSTTEGGQHGPCDVGIHYSIVQPVLMEKGRRERFDSGGEKS